MNVPEALKQLGETSSLLIKIADRLSRAMKKRSERRRLLALIEYRPISWHMNDDFEERIKRGEPITAQTLFNNIWDMIYFRGSVIVAVEDILSSDTMSHEDRSTILSAMNWNITSLRRLISHFYMISKNVSGEKTIKIDGDAHKIMIATDMALAVLFAKIRSCMTLDNKNDITIDCGDREFLRQVCDVLKMMVRKLKSIEIQIT